ncbi:hypothetical protein HanRHA438_Chr15g0706931 [Helianthus annuus]|nr:hypothetical protein HanRHA438_Chr15g0706931 [Helianthus annuus]
MPFSSRGLASFAAFILRFVFFASRTKSCTSIFPACDFIKIELELFLAINLTSILVNTTIPSTLTHAFCNCGP